MKHVLVYCSSSTKLSPFFYEEMRLLGKALADSGFGLVFGGGRDGLMGSLSEAYIKANGPSCIGVTPAYFNTPEIMQDGLTELYETPDLLTRKKKMFELCDFIVASPGGIGTFDEISEAICLKQVKEINKPIYIHNFMSYWDNYLNVLLDMKQQDMIGEELSEMYHVVNDHKQLIGALKNET